MGARILESHNRSYEIARGTGNELDPIVIHGSEITRKMPPGYLNVIVLKDSEFLDVPEWRDCIRAAYAQGAFIFWNHPNYPGGKGEIWYPEHTEFLKPLFEHSIRIPYRVKNLLVGPDQPFETSIQVHIVSRTYLPPERCHRNSIPLLPSGATSRITAAHEGNRG